MSTSILHAHPDAVVSTLLSGSHRARDWQLANLHTMRSYTAFYLGIEKMRVSLNRVFTTRRFVESAQESLQVPFWCYLDGAKKFVARCGGSVASWDTDGVNLKGATVRWNERGEPYFSVDPEELDKFYRLFRGAVASCNTQADALLVLDAEADELASWLMNCGVHREFIKSPPEFVPYASVPLRSGPEIVGDYKIQVSVTYESYGPYKKAYLDVRGDNVKTFQRVDRSFGCVPFADDAVAPLHELLLLVQDREEDAFRDVAEMALRAYIKDWCTPAR